MIIKTLQTFKMLESWVTPSSLSTISNTFRRSHHISTTNTTRKGRLGEPTFKHKKLEILVHDWLWLLTVNASQAPEDSRLPDSIQTNIIMMNLLASYSNSKLPRKDYNQFRWCNVLMLHNTLLYVPNCVVLFGVGSLRESGGNRRGYGLGGGKFWDESCYE